MKIYLEEMLTVRRILERKIEIYFITEMEEFRCIEN